MLSGLHNITFVLEPLIVRAERYLLSFRNSILIGLLALLACLVCIRWRPSAARTRRNWSLRVILIPILPALTVSILLYTLGGQLAWVCLGGVTLYGVVRTVLKDHSPYRTRTERLGGHVLSQLVNTKQLKALDNTEFWEDRWESS